MSAGRNHYKVGALESPAIGNICVKKKWSSLKQDNKRYVLGGISKILPFPSKEGKRVKVNTFKRFYFEKSPSVSLRKGLPKDWFPRNPLTVLGYSVTQRTLQSWSKRNPLLLKLLADLGIIHMVPVFQVCGMQELWGYGCIHPHFKGRPGWSY